MAELVKTKSEKSNDIWNVWISGTCANSRNEVWKNFEVTAEDLQSDSQFFKGLILVKAFYDYGFMNGENMESNIYDLTIHLKNEFDIEPDSTNSADMCNILWDFLAEWLPSDEDFDRNRKGYRCGKANIYRSVEEDYPLGKIFIRIVDSDDNDYELKYDRADIIDALKTYEIAK